MDSFVVTFNPAKVKVYILALRKEGSALLSRRTDASKGERDALGGGIVTSGRRCLGCAQGWPR